MNHDFLIKNTNRVAVLTTIALWYWVLIFVTITVFDLKVFRAYITQTFYFSLLGIFAILAGALVLNIMSNLSKISAALASRSGTEAIPVKSNKWRFYLMLASLPLVVALLFAGNQLTEQRKKLKLIAAAEHLVAENQSSLASLADYKFSYDYVLRVASIMQVIKRIDKNFPEVQLIVADKLGDKTVFLGLGDDHYRHFDKNEAREMSHYIFSATQSERDYLHAVFTSKTAEVKFQREANSYQLYYPLELAGKKFVLYFSDYQRYGKI